MKYNACARVGAKAESHAEKYSLASYMYVKTGK